MTHAYSEIYLSKARMTLAWMMHYGVNQCDIPAEDFFICSSNLRM